jgi:hypothetical protein
MINFIERRDLNSDYIRNYKKKMHEVWNFVNNDGSAEEVSLVDEEIEIIEI